MDHRNAFGTVKTSTLALALRSEGFLVEQHDGFLVVEAGDETPDLRMVLARLSAGYTATSSLALKT